MTAHISGLLCVSSLIYRTVHGTFFYLRRTAWNNIGMKIVLNQRGIAIFQYKEWFVLPGAVPSVARIIIPGTEASDTNNLGNCLFH
jgi:hypothetical protein